MAGCAARLGSARSAAARKLAFQPVVAFSRRAQVLGIRETGRQNPARVVAHGGQPHHIVGLVNQEQGVFDGRDIAVLGDRVLSAVDGRQLGPAAEIVVGDDHVVLRQC